jgi:signal transduction histidine kinase
MPRRAPSRSAKAASSPGTRAWVAELEELLAQERAARMAAQGALGDALDQQAATAEVLDVISRSPTDPQRVMDTIVAAALRLCRAENASLVRIGSGGQTYLQAGVGSTPQTLMARRAGQAATPGRDSAAGRAIVDGVTVHIPDAATVDPVEFALARQRFEEFGTRSILAVPLVGRDAVQGCLLVSRTVAGAFSDQQVRLLESFADQAVIAIENARLFQELADKSHQLEEASRHKSEFLANMSHELRTPLNAVIGFTEVLLERYFGEINAKQEEYLRDVLSSGQHLLSLINDILDLSKVEAGRMELEVSTFDLGPVLEAGLVMVKERATRKGIALSLEVDQDTGRVEADERKVKQVAFNLLTNAVKFTPDGGRITVSARRRDGRVEVVVADTGVGIAPEEQGRVFEEFGQARSAAGQSEGTGLGLALCKRFVELHGGSIAVASQLGGGSTFTVSLPVRQRDPAVGPSGQR